MSILSTLIAKLKELQAQLFLQTHLHPVVQHKADMLIAIMKDIGHPCGISQGFRSKAEQDRLYAQGRTSPGAIVTNAKGGQSFHNYGVAVDIVFIENGQLSWAEHHPWELLGKTGESLGFEWGGRWTTLKDRPHFQYRHGYTLEDFQLGKVDYNIIK